MGFDRQLRLLDALLRVVEATHDAMRIAFEKEDEPGPSSQTILMTEDEIPEVLKPTKPSRRPTRMMPSLTKESFRAHIEHLLEHADTDDQKDAVRVALERGLVAQFISPQDADEILLKLVPR